MVKTRTVKFLVTEEQFGSIRNNALLKGMNVSQYLRNLSLSHDIGIECMIVKMYEVVVHGR